MGRCVRVLIVEESADDSDRLALELRRGGLDVFHQRVDTAAALAAAIAQQPWDIVIADYSMPHFNGLAALAMVRQHRLELPFILVSGPVGEEIVVQALKAGANDFLLRGKLARLVPAVERELGDAEARRQHLAAAQALRDRERELREARDQLEVRVRDRTRELSEANASLEQEIAERRRAQEELKAAKEAAEVANRSKSEFLANMSHEIRTPMTAILGYADMLLEPGESVSERLDHVQTIRKNARQLLELLNDILDLSKVEAGKLDIERVAVDPRQAVTDVVALMQVRAEKKGIGLEVKYVGPLPQTIHTDPTRLRQILINLIGNAIKFTDKGGVSVLVAFAPCAGEAAMLEFVVVDTGIGLTQVQMAGLFKPFAQVDSSATRRFGGTGLGLTISKRLAAKLGGDITVQSEPGRGSRFALTIATGDLEGVKLLHDATEAVNPPAAHHEPRPTISLQGRVLLAEDGIHNQRVITFYLQSAGLEVTVAENGRIACDKAIAATDAGRPFDLILMDMQMPEMDGYDATRTLRARGFAGPIIAVTANAMSHDRAKCLESGCSEYFSKPIDGQQLLAAVAEHLTAAGSSNGREQPICSGVAADMAQFLPSFVAELPSVVRQLAMSLDRKNLDELRRTVHQLKGSCGFYGFLPIASAAERIETQLHPVSEFDSIATEVRSLIDLVRRVEGYEPSKEAVIVRQPSDDSRTGSAPE